MSQKVWKIGILISVMLLCILTVSIILSSISHFKASSQLAGFNHISNLSHLLVRQQAKLFSLMLVRTLKTEEITEALDTFSEEEFVIDASIYSPTGTLIAKSHNTLTFNPKIATPNNTQQIVEPILAQQNLVGFLRVTFDSQYGQTTQNKVNELFHLLYGELIILFLSGGLFISCFYAFSRYHPHTPHNAQKSINAVLKTQTQRFHSRRRAFRRK